MSRPCFIVRLAALLLIAMGCARAEAQRAAAEPFVFLPPEIRFPSNWCGATGVYQPYLPLGKVEFSLRQSDGIYDAPAKLRPSADATLIYPYSMLRIGSSGTVLVKFTVEANGTISKAEITYTSHPAFAEALESQLYRMKFAPAKQRGAAVRSVATCEFAFEATAEGL